KKYQPACYLEQSGAFEQLNPEKSDYTRTMGYCRQIRDPLNRMACVKLFAIRAVRIEHYTDIANMCANTSSSEERVMCTAVAGEKIASSMDTRLNPQLFRDAITDTCATLPVSLAFQCQNLALHQRKQLFVTSSADLTFLKDERQGE
ncbi:MAG: hypothetical protein RIQ56_102, partial [Candidatus Parcubacteria bacterium]